MRVELIEHQHNAFGVGIVDVDQFLDTVGEVDPGAPCADPDVTPPAQRFAHDEEVGDSTPDVLRIMPRRSSGGCRQRGAHLTQQLPTGFIQADDWPRRIGRPLIDRQDILHVPDEGRIGRRGQAPLFRQPRLEIVFLSVWRTVS